MLLGLLKSVQKARCQTSDEVVGGAKTNYDIKLDNVDGTQMTSPLKQCQRDKLPPLRLIIMSASLDARIFSEYFGGARAVHVQGRQFPVDIFYTLYAETDYIDAAMVTIFQVKKGGCNIKLYY